jgi:glycosyltransferase involved in cell wall biosynthesis
MAGLPVLSSPLDAVVNVVRTYDVGQIVPSSSPADIGEAINAMLADRDALARMHSNALEAAKQEFNWEKEAQRLVSLYHTLVNRQNLSHPAGNSSSDQRAIA